MVTGDSHNFSWEGMMSLPIRYSLMAFYFWLSIIFLTLQVLWHLLHQRDLLRPLHEGSHDHHWLYPIPIAPSVQYHVRDLPYDLWTTPLHFPFLVSFLYPTHSFVVRPITDHCTAWSGPYHTLCHTQPLCSFYLLFVLKTFVSTLKKKEVFPPELRLTFVSSHHFISLRLHTFIPSLYFILLTPFALSHHSEPPSHTISHSLILHQETISLLQNCTPQNHIGYTLRSPSPLIFVTF